MRVVATPADYDELYTQWQGKTVALVPTMGALHEGHMALIRYARQLADVAVVSIFVNPLQFGPTEDLSRYPRPLEQDLGICRELGVDAVFTPSVDTLYPAGMANVTTVVPPENLTEHFCGEFRPGHFTGVATVVLKLFNLLRPSVAVFGEKDAQQLMVIRKMTRDLHVPVTIVPYPTVREESGLALSSRNRYLQTEAEQQAARCLYRILNRIREQVQASEQRLDAKTTLESISRQVLGEVAHPDVTVCLQYLEAVDKNTFAPVQILGPDSKILIAAYVNQVRLIDNLDLG
ncbi:MAG: pantoate/beta-alanine ligase [Vampirovibrio sp.]|jgi:pantoate--beta-alanine ligase|nr:pantoate/beta-alanine ligase [Vampirovibrio sp.]